MRQLCARGCTRIFVEGGGVTVSAFLEAGLLDRLHIAVAPLLIGEGRPAIRMAPRRLLKDCMKVQPRIYRTGEDVLFDCDSASECGRCAAEEARRGGSGARFVRRGVPEGSGLRSGWR